MTTGFLPPEEFDCLRAASQAIPEPAPDRFDSPILVLLVSSGREQYTRLIKEQTFAPGQVVVTEGKTGDTMYVIRSGRAVVFKGDICRPIILGYRGVGEIIGEMALLENKTRSASIVALEELVVFCISRDSFQHFLSSNPAVGMSILGALSTRLRAADKARFTIQTQEQKLSRQVSALETEKKHLLELNRLRQETSDLIIHDLRNPLSLIAGGVNLLELTLPEELLNNNGEIMHLINSNLERIQRLVDSLLDVAQIESGDTAFDFLPHPLSPLLHNAVAQIMPIFKSYDIKISIHIPADLPVVKVDEEKISRVLTNLMDNAVKYTPGGGVVTVEAKVTAERVQISVSNSGPVILSEDRQRIFERFTRVSSGKAHTRGFGLGLAFCRLAIEAHGGKIWVEPGSGGVGNRFIFDLPTFTFTPTNAQ